MDGVFIYEFLFRGGETSAPDDDTWHVILARKVTTIDGKEGLETLGPLPPQRAAELGFTLDKILTGLNQKAVETVGEVRALNAKLEETVREQNHALEVTGQQGRALASQLAVALDKGREPR